MKYASRFDQFCHELVAFTKEYWFEVAILCVGLSVIFWSVIALYKW